MTEQSTNHPFETTGHAYDLMQQKLGDDGMQQLNGQLNIWHELNELPQLESPLRESLGSGSDVLPQGTLFHGVRYDAEILKSMAELGVVSGELLGIFEDSETHGCADFFKAPTDTTVEQYFEWAKEPMQVGSVRMSKGEKNYLAGRVTVVVDPNAKGMAPLVIKDAYQDETMNFTRLPHGRTPETTAALLGGVPRGSIAGLIFPDRIAQDPARIAEVRQLFPGTPLLTQAGSLIEAPAQTQLVE